LVSVRFFLAPPIQRPIQTLRLFVSFASTPLRSGYRRSGSSPCGCVCASLRRTAPSASLQARSLRSLGVFAFYSKGGLLDASLKSSLRTWMGQYRVGGSFLARLEYRPTGSFLARSEERSRTRSGPSPPTTRGDTDSAPARCGYGLFFSAYPGISKYIYTQFVALILHFLAFYLHFPPRCSPVLQKKY